ncbi:hypothetical protein A5710_00830 [Mycolicibacter sinensis]|uniref:Uncharacterized protein n=2 Tax=Mycolicibacter sinensis (strain JDM601) TaxID=875328 RepID=A0A1A2XHC3_MYCSD|nr:hypothetical protein A5710_00830 [Mycolicibacter sinensis]
MGQQLYRSALRAATSASKRGAPLAEAGNGPFAQAIKAGRRPPDSLVQHLDDWEEFHNGQAADLGAAIDKSQDHYRPRFEQALQGEAGEALLAAHDDNVRLWSRHQSRHQTAATASYQASAQVQNVQAEIDDLAQAGEEEFNAAVQQRDSARALSVWQSYSSQADAVVAKATPTIASTVKGAGFTIPMDAPIDKHGSSEKDDSKQSKQGEDSKPTGKEGDGDAKQGGDAKPAGNTADGGDATQSSDAKPTANGTNGGDAIQSSDAKPTANGANGGDATQNRMPNGMPMMPSQARTAGSGGAGMPSGLGSGLGSGGPGGLGSGMGSGMSSGLSPSSLSSGLGSAGTSPASAGGSPFGSMPSPLADAGAGFQSGLASGMGSSGGMAPISQMSQQPLAPFSSQQPMVAAPPAGGAVSPAGMTPSAGLPAASQPAGVAGSGGFGAPGGMAGGMVPPAGAMGAAGQPLAPYSPPGAGVPPGGASTAPAAGGGPAPAGSGSTSGGGPSPVMAGGPGTSGAMTAAAAASEDTNPDVVTAQRVLAGLVRGSEASEMLVVWAVAVLRSPYGSQIMVANNMGGGGYLPAKVFLPTTAHLAVSDPVLPIGWAADWMGCQRPSKILADHFTRLRKLVAGVSVSAMVTTELWPEPPGCGGDFVPMQHRDVLGMLSQAPRLDGGHLHRLAVLDQGLAQRVDALDRGGDVSAWAAATLTGTVFKEAAKPDGTGSALVHAIDAEILQAVNDGTADAERWKAYDRAAEQRDSGAALWPDTHAPRDNDGSDAARAAILWYQHYYRAGRMIELVRCWKARPPRLAEVVYCAITAGFGSLAVSTLAAMEHHLGEQGK